MSVGAARSGSAAPGGRMTLVDGLRGLAALWVVFFHVNRSAAGLNTRALAAGVPGFAALCDLGTLGVYVFFALSGFVIAHSVARHRMSGAFVARFALRRSLRLDPPYWASMLLVVGVDLGLSFLGHPFAPPEGARVAAHLVYLQDILELSPLSAVYWTLCLEIQFYLVFCGLLWAAERAGRGLLAIFGPVLFVAAAWPLLGLRAPWPGSFVPYWYGFLAGMLACWSVRGLVSRQVFVGFCLVLLLGAGRAALADDGRHGLEIAASAGVALLLEHAGRSGRIFTWLGWRPLQALGAISYSLYLLHDQALTVGFAVARRFLPRTLAGEAAGATLVLLGTLAAAWLMAQLIERPSMALARRVSLSGAGERSTLASPPPGRALDAAP